MLHFMNSALLLTLLFTCALISCNNNKNNNVLSTSNLTAYSVTINSDSGYSLKSPHGALIKISSNGFRVAPNSKVTIEIKEAYTVQDILIAGMATQSSGKPLRSAGMFYFRASVENKEVEFIKPVQVTIPAKLYDSSMQVFASEIKDDSSINWINPEPMDTSPVVKNLLLGKALFNSKCASCHSPTAKLIGSPLAGARERSPNPEWVYRFVNNPVMMMKNDAYARRLGEKYKFMIMTSFPELTKSSIDAIFDYCDNEALLNPVNKSDTGEVHCGYDTLYYPRPKTGISVFPFGENSLDSIRSNDRYFIDTVTSNQGIESAEDEFTKKGFKYISPPRGMYQFNISESGWYNIDVLLKDENASKVKLVAKVEMQDRTDVRLMLCIPQRKILLEAEMQKNDVYIFDQSSTDGYLPLILNDDAFIIGTVSNGEKIYFGIAPFKINSQQTVTVKIKESTKEEVLSGIRNNNLDSVKLDIEKQEMEIIKKPCYDEYLASDTIRRSIPAEKN